MTDSHPDHGAAADVIDERNAPDPHVPVIAEGERTPAHDEIPKEQRKPGTVPPGTFDAELREVAIVRRQKDGAHLLRLLARTVELDRYVIAWHNLSKNEADPFDLTPDQLRSLRRVADRLCVPSLCPAQEIVQNIAATLRVPVTATVKRTAVGQSVTLSRTQTLTADATRATAALEAGETQSIDEVIAELDAADPAELAHSAHFKLVEGQRGVRLSLALMAEGCHLLYQQEGWKHLGYETLSEYLAAPEIEISRTDFYRMVEIWSAYVLNGGVEPQTLQGAGPSKLEVPLPALTAGVVSAEQAVADASSMTRKDLRSHYAGLMGAEGVEPKRREKPPIEITDEMVDRGARALCDAGAAVVLNPTESALVVLRAALNPNEETA
jgi:hypothetical protein